MLRRVGISAGLAILILTFVCSLSIDAAAGVVSGTVVNSAGQPIPNAWIEAMPRNYNKSDTAIGTSYRFKADNYGRFNIKLPPGRYKLVAKQEDDGYPDPIFALNSDPTARFPEISVQKDISGVQVMLGMRGGVLEGYVADKQTGNPIQQAKITIREVQDAGAYVEVFSDKRGHFEFTVPKKSVRLSATARGYETTKFGGEIILSESEHRRISIELKRQ